MAWSKAIVLALIGVYTAYIVNNIHRHTSSPVCTSTSRDCLEPAVALNESFYLNIFLTTSRGDRLRYDKSVTLRDQDGNRHPIMAPARKSGFKSVHVGTILTSIDKQYDCGNDSIIHGSGATEPHNSSFLSRLGRQRLCKTHLDWQVPEAWRDNQTEIWIVMTSTLYRNPVEIAFPPYTAPLTSLYHPETKTKSARRYLLKSTDNAEMRAMFDGAPYTAVPPRIAVGPLGFAKPLDRDALARSHMYHWLQYEGKRYRQSLMVNPYISPRDEHYPLAKPDLTGTKFPVHPTIRFEFSPTSYRAAAIQAMMKPALSQMETAFGASQYDSDSIMLLIVGESPIVLLMTFAISVLHLIFELLAMSSNWNHVKDMVADPALNKSLSRKSILLEICFEIAIAGWLWDEGEAKIVQIVIAARIAFNSWKLCKLGKPLQDEKNPMKDKTPMTAKPLLTLTELSHRRDAMTAEEFEVSCLKSIAWLLSPVFVGIAAYQLLYEPHKSWLSWVLKTGALFSYLGGFLAMTPQLFTNYYYRTVESLSWTALIYQFLNTIIDDVFAFVIRMPNAHRISVFRDDLILLIYYLQKRHYKNKKADHQADSAKKAN